MCLLFLSLILYPPMSLLLDPLFCCEYHHFYFGTGRNNLPMEIFQLYIRQYSHRPVVTGLIALTLVP